MIVSAQSSVFSGGGSAGTLTFNGISTGGWSGSTTINHSMTLTTTSTVAATNKVLNNTTGITLNGGAIQFTRDGNTALGAISDTADINVYGGGTFSVTSTNGGASAIENIGAVIVNSGQMNLVQTNNNTNQLVLASLSRGASTTSAVTFSSGGFGTAKFVVTGNGGVATTAGQIFAPWATTGTSAAAQTDYAVFNASNEIGAAGASLTTAAESGWGSDTTAYQFSTNQTLSGNRNAAALRYTGVTQAIALGGNTLKTNGILNGGTGVLTVSGTGALTATGVSGGNLFLTTGNNGITVSSNITDNGGAVTVVKGGSNANALTLSGNNDFTGGIVVNAGTLRLSGTQSFTGGVTLSGGAFGDSTDGIAATELNSNSVTVNGNASMYISLRRTRKSGHGRAKLSYGGGVRERDRRSWIEDQG